MHAIGKKSQERGRVDFYKLSLYGLALAFAAGEASAAATIRAVSPGTSPSAARSATVAPRPAAVDQSRAAALARTLPRSVNLVSSTTSSAQGGGGISSEVIDEIHRVLDEKANKDDVYTKEETDREISDAIANINGKLASHEYDVYGKADKVTGAIDGNLAALDSDGNLFDSGVSSFEVVTVGPDGKIDSALYNSGTEIPTPPMTPGGEYVLLASSDGSKVWVRVRSEFVKNW